jgi:hypothetical protein
MYLLRQRVTKLGPFGQLEIGFTEEGEPRLMTVIHGAGGLGKSTLLHALSSTRPGNTLVPHGYLVDTDEPGTTACEYYLGQDDPERLHPLIVASPNARVFPDEEREAIRRREQALFDRVAREAGFVFFAIPATRWFSRQPLAISAPARGVARYDVRAPVALDDPTRADLARETKQALAYAVISSAIATGHAGAERFARLAAAMQHAVNTLLELVHLRWTGVDPHTWEPTFVRVAAPGSDFVRADPMAEREQLENLTDALTPFDALPNCVRHLIAFAALPVRALWAAYPMRDPLKAEGIVTIDEVELHQETAVLSRLVPTLRLALPQVQWIVTTASPMVATSCDVHELITLRRPSEHGAVELYTGEVARTH